MDLHLKKNQRHPVILFVDPVVAFGNQLTAGSCEHAELRVKAKIMQLVIKLFPVEIRRDDIQRKFSGLHNSILKRENSFCY